MNKGEWVVMGKGVPHHWLAYCMDMEDGYFRLYEYNNFFDEIDFTKWWLKQPTDHSYFNNPSSPTDKELSILAMIQPEMYGDYLKIKEVV